MPPKARPIKSIHCKGSSVKADLITPCFPKKPVAEVQEYSSTPHAQASDRHCIPMPSSPSRGASTCCKRARSLHLITSSLTSCICPPFSYVVLLKARKYSTSHCNFSSFIIAPSLLSSGLLKAGLSDQLPFSDRAEEPRKSLRL